MSKKKKIYSEVETRKKLLNSARYIGCEMEMIHIFNNIDRLLKNCTNDQERQEIAAFGAIQIHKLLGAGEGTLEINGKTIFDNRQIIDPLKKDLK